MKGNHTKKRSTISFNRFKLNLSSPSRNIISQQYQGVNQSLISDRQPEGFLQKQSLQLTSPTRKNRSQNEGSPFFEARTYLFEKSLPKTSRSPLKDSCTVPIPSSAPYRNLEPLSLPKYDFSSMLGSYDETPKTRNYPHRLKRQVGPMFYSNVSQYNPRDSNEAQPVQPIFRQANTIQVSTFLSEIEQELIFDKEPRLIQGDLEDSGVREIMNNGSSYIQELKSVLNENSQYSSSEQKRNKKIIFGDRKRCGISTSIQIKEISPANKKLKSMSFRISDDQRVKMLQQVKDEDEKIMNQDQDLQIKKFDNLLRHKLRNQFFELSATECILTKDASPPRTIQNKISTEHLNEPDSEFQLKKSVPCTLYVMEKERQTLIEKIKEIQRSPKGDKPTTVNSSIIKQLKLKNISDLHILEKVQGEEKVKYKAELITKDPYSNALYNLKALDKRSKSRVQKKLEEQLPLLSRFNQLN